MEFPENVFVACFERNSDKALVYFGGRMEDMRAPAISSANSIYYSSYSDDFERSNVMDKLIIPDGGPYEGLESGCVS